MKRRSSIKVAKRNEGILEQIRALKSEHPFWGYRRIWAHLRYVGKLAVNRKRILRLMREHDLLVKPNMKIRASRSVGRSKPRPSAPNQWWGIDMTKIMIGSFGWMYVVLVLDWHTKKVVGWYAGPQCTSRHWLLALDMAVNRQFPDGARGRNLHLMSDNGSQPTSIAFMRACDTMGIEQAFTSYNNPKGNADTERMMRTMKEECLWLREWSNPLELIDSLGQWVECYNESYLHSSLGYMPPAKFENEWNRSHPTQLAAA